jgi:hypothetical protein
MNHVQKIIRTEFVDLKFFYNFYCRHFSVGRVSTIASPSEKEVHVSMRSKVRGYDGTSKMIILYKPLTFDLMETLDLFLQVPYLLWMNHVPKMNITKFVDLKVFYNFNSLHFSVGRV